MMNFYFHHTPNPMKVALFLKETGMDYDIIAVDTYKGEQHTPEYRLINPNAKTPAIVDEGKRVFDSNAILLYLAEKEGKLLGKSEDKGELLSWFMFIATGLGPYSGQSVHFKRVAPDVEYAANRYHREAQRHYEVLNEHLEGREYFVSDEFTIVDISAWGWIDRANFVLGEGQLQHYPHVARWFNRINERAAVQQARAIGSELTFKSDVDEETKRSLFPQNYPEVHA
ncbi:glutathione S-transferase family protein [Vibrio sp.]|nr:glutathione S-transferase family protein [Vibrio sp.]